jgi:hypothetical protein
MTTLDKLPQPAPEYDPQKFLQDFLLMDAALGAVESEIENAQRLQDAARLASTLEEGKQIITRMLEFLKKTYEISDGRIKMSPVFKSYKLNFPYKPPELWDIVTEKKQPYHEDVEAEFETSEDAARGNIFGEDPAPELGGADDIATAINLCLEKKEEE